MEAYLALSAFYRCITCLQMFCSFLENSNTNFEARNESRSCVVKYVKIFITTKISLYTLFEVVFILNNDACIV